MDLTPNQMQRTSDLQRQSFWSRGTSAAATATAVPREGVVPRVSSVAGLWIAGVQSGNSRMKDGAVQAESMTLLFGGESVLKKAAEIFGRDPNAIVDHGEADALAALRNLQDQFPVGLV